MSDIWAFGGRTYIDQSEQASDARARWWWRWHRRRYRPENCTKPHIRLKTTRRA